MSNLSYFGKDFNLIEEQISQNKNWKYYHIKVPDSFTHIAWLGEIEKIKNHSLDKIETIALECKNVINFKELSKLKNLKNLRIINNEKLKNNNFKEFAKLKNIQELYIYKSKLDNLKEISTCKQLKSLRLINTEITEFNEIGKLENLNNLQIFTRIDFNLDFLVKLQNLKSISITGNKISDISIFNQFKHREFDLIELSLKNSTKYSKINWGVDARELNLEYFEGEKPNFHLLNEITSLINSWRSYHLKITCIVNQEFIDDLFLVDFRGHEIIINYLNNDFSFFDNLSIPKEFINNKDFRNLEFNSYNQKITKKKYDKYLLNNNYKFNIYHNKKLIYAHKEKIKAGLLEKNSITFINNSFAKNKELIINDREVFSTFSNLRINNSSFDLSKITSFNNIKELHLFTINVSQLKNLRLLTQLERLTIELIDLNRDDSYSIKNKILGEHYNINNSIDSIDFSFVKNLKKLKYLCINNNDYGNVELGFKKIEFPHIDQILKSNIKELRIPDIVFFDDNLNTENTTVNKLDLELSSGYSLNNNLKIDKLKIFSRLKKLECEIYHFIKPDNSEFLEAIKNIEELSLYSNFLGNDDEKIDLSILRKLKKLKKIKLQLENFNREEIIFLIKSLSKTNIQELSLSNSILTYGIVDGLKKISNLKKFIYLTEYVTLYEQKEQLIDNVSNLRSCLPLVKKNVEVFFNKINLTKILQYTDQINVNLWHQFPDVPIDQIKELDIKILGINDNFPFFVWDLEGIDKLKNLEKLNIACDNYIDEFGDELTINEDYELDLEPVSKLKKLRSINIPSKIYELKNAKSLLKIPKLETANVSGVIHEGMKKKSSLKHIRLDYGDEEFIDKISNKLPNIEGIDLCYVEFIDVNKLKSFKKLKKITGDYSHIEYEYEEYDDDYYDEYGEPDSRIVFYLDKIQNLEEIYTLDIWPRNLNKLKNLKTVKNLLLRINTFKDLEIIKDKKLFIEALSINSYLTTHGQHINHTDGPYNLEKLNFIQDSIKELSIKNLEIIFDDSFKILSKFNNLNSIEINNCSFHSEHKKIIDLNIFSSMKNISKITFTNNHGVYKDYDYGDYSDGNFLPPNINELDYFILENKKINNLENLKILKIDAIITTLKNFQNLELDSLIINNGDIKNLHIDPNSPLTSTLKEIKICPKSAINLQGIENLQFLEELTIKNPNKKIDFGAIGFLKHLKKLTIEDVENFESFEIFSNLKKLENIKIKGENDIIRYISDFNFKYFENSKISKIELDCKEECINFNAIEILTNLEVLSLKNFQTFNNFKNIKENKSLRRIELSNINCEIDLSYLNKMEKLEFVNINDCPAIKGGDKLEKNKKIKTDIKNSIYLEKPKYKKIKKIGSIHNINGSLVITDNAFKDNSNDNIFKKFKINKIDSKSAGIYGVFTKAGYVEKIYIQLNFDKNHAQKLFKEKFHEFKIGKKVIDIPIKENSLHITTDEENDTNDKFVLNIESTDDLCSVYEFNIEYYDNFKPKLLKFGYVLQPTDEDDYFEINLN